MKKEKKNKSQQQAQRHTQKKQFLKCINKFKKL